MIVDMKLSHGSATDYAIKFWAKSDKNSHHYENKKLSCRRQTARRFVSVNILLSHSRSSEMALLIKACVSPY